MTRHCDDYIDDPAAPACLRAFLAHARAPAIEHAGKDRPPLFAKRNGRIVRVTMASRFGDVGVSENLDEPYGYGDRVTLSELTDFASTTSGIQY